MNRTKPVIFAICFFACSSTFAQTYENLLSGDRLDHWQKQNGNAVGEGWNLENGVLHLSSRGGNIVTRELYGDFELWFEFRTTAEGNNGIKYRVKQYDKSWLGLEYQVLDDDAFPNLTRDHLTAALYDLVIPKPAETRLNARDEFNVGKIRVENHRTRHWVNGQLMIDQRLVGPEWKTVVANSKFKNRTNFGENALGRIMITDHGKETWYRNVFIRRLNCQCN